VAILLLGVLETRQVLELRAGKRRRRTRLERTAEEQLGREQRSELHVKRSAGGGHVGAVGGGLLGYRLSIYGGDVPAPWMPVGKTGDVRGKGAMGEARIAVGRLRDMAEATDRGAWPRVWTGHILHPEQMRRDKIVPTDVRKHSRFEGLDAPRERHGVRSI
jgi:hypothetical protein